MSISAGVSPTSAEVRAHILAAQRKSPRLVSVRTIIRTGEGRPIDAVTVTDKDVSDVDKQNVLIVAGQHGNEESGRMVALALIDWLVTAAGAATRRKQKIVIMPNVNPDGAERDIYTTPAGIRPNSDHAAGGAKTPEGIAVEKVAYPLAPEVFVDVHARGGAGCSHDMVLYPATRLYTEDEYIFRQIADDMVEAGEKTGIPHVTHTLIWWGGGKPDNTSTTRMCYCTFKSIVMLTENAEHNDFAYPPAARIRSGLARLKALLAWGNRRYSKLYYPGYPFQLAMGMFHRGIVAVGKTAAARRRSRLGIWHNADAFKAIGVELPEQATHKKLFVEYEGPLLPAGAGFQLRTRGRLRPLRVSLNGRKLSASPTGGYCWWRDHCSTFVMAAMRKLQPGRHELVIDFGKSRARRAGRASGKR